MISSSRSVIARAVSRRFVLFEGGILPEFEAADTEPLAFYGGVAFLAGFNERFAQDMLAGSQRQLTNRLAPGAEARPNNVEEISPDDGDPQRRPIN
jgi:hypothetical protein